MWKVWYILYDTFCAFGSTTKTRTKITTKITTKTKTKQSQQQQQRRRRRSTTTTTRTPQKQLTVLNNYLINDKNLVIISWNFLDTFIIHKNKKDIIIIKCCLTA